MARIAVIGAGMGAMATAARLAVAGHQVTVYERGTTYGGAVGRYERDGFAFDTGPGLLHLPAVYRDLFVKTGKRPLEDCVELVQVDPAVRHVLADATVVTLPNASRGGAAAVLDQTFGAGAGERWSAVLGRARDAWDATRRPLLEEPLRPDWQALGGDPYPALRKSGLLRRRPPTLAEVADRELGGPLAQLLTARVGAYGLDPATAPASAAVLPYMEQTFGSWYVRGGIRALATAVYERCLERKVAFVFGAEVREVLARGGRAAGLLLADGTEAAADAVVCGVDPRQLPIAPSIPPVPGSPPARNTGLADWYTLFLALRGARPGDAVHRTLLDSVTVLRPDDPATRPDAEHEAVTVHAVVRSGSPAPSAEELLTTAARAVPGLRERLLWHELRTPGDIAEATGAVDGSVPAPALAGAGGRLLHPANTTALPGLYLAGGWAHPGGGLPHAGMTGALVAGLIVEGADFRGSR
ncbi:MULTISPECIES: NAD(P)/FAD-dependent oxidoreductase [unclassified Streptomyces]|uniref:phytoene desaturase family protein n=1 Tax=unclassified Streptomyces TaxID=2593676 RepID=UPI001BE5FE85|nr:MULTISPECIES: NAD(P)/FAD-dependent oxidoreductase [unclassified Streptomyces]MBT2405931.1 NAD(P)/FAD-dependent oxidoreductase [Streptomyces sp. ISL-21]MBT2453951.1 NAD(P)/FAD-dependent oxidoreductase [Streptomyces sp. ISL-86]MBT2608527.1 NAD(P)/FAD-dependent oxidoreductase [Streptomyces sp. ISL-87]